MLMPNRYSECIHYLYANHTFSLLHATHLLAATSPARYRASAGPRWARTRALSSSSGIISAVSSRTRLSSCSNVAYPLGNLMHKVKLLRF